MKKFLICLVLLAAGCTGPSKYTVAKSQVESLAENWDITAKATDPWDHDIIIKVTKRSNQKYLEVRSCGPDGLPFTDDDIVATRWRVEDDKSFLESGAEDISRGVVNGAKQGMKK